MIAEPETRIAGKVCPLCGDEGRAIPEDHPCGGYGARVCSCSRGSILLCWPFASGAEYLKQYFEPDGGYHDRLMQETQRQPFVYRDAEFLGTAHARLRKLRGLYPDAKRLLDIGAGTGSLVAMAPVFGFEAAGIEPNPQIAAWASTLGRHLLIGGWGSLAPVGEWDVITLYDVLEHLLEPLDALRHLAECLREDGVLVVEMPEFLAPGGNWERHIKPHEHPCLYSFGAALELFQRAGFRWDCIDRPVGGTLGKITYYLRRA